MSGISSRSSADLRRLLDRDGAGDPDLGVRDVARPQGPVRRSAGAPSGVYGLTTVIPSIWLACVEEVGHRRLDVGVGDALLGAEDDGAALAARRRVGEVLVEDVEARRLSTSGRANSVL